MPFGTAGEDYNAWFPPSVRSPLLVRFDMNAATITPDNARVARRAAVVDIAAVFVVFAFFGAWPAPDVNETHYLTKAKHFWEPGWCERDLFLASRDSHVVYYATFGYLAHALPLATAAWCGRLIGWAMLAIGWRHLSFTIAPRIGIAPLTAACAVVLNQHGQMAGEWFVGGIEAKVPAYALVFFGLADILRSRWNRGLVFLGAGSAFHVLAGGWSLVAVGLVWLTDVRRPSLSSILPGLAGGAILSLAGVVPGLALSSGVDGALLVEADKIYVFQRLAHHLWAPDFIPKFGLHHLTLIASWSVICRASPGDDAVRRLRWFVGGAIALAVIGTAISYASPEPTDWGARLLKYYWFRLSDVAVAVGASLELARSAAATASSPLRNRAATAILAAVGLIGASNVALQRHRLEVPRGERIADAATYSEWQEACGWIREQLPADAIVVAPRTFMTFKWFAERAEYAAWKDVPQDARSLLQWKERLDDLYGTDGASGGWVNYVPPERIIAVCRKYDASHIVTYRIPAIELPIVYRNNSFAVYRVPQK